MRTKRMTRDELVNQLERQVAGGRRILNTEHGAHPPPPQQADDAIGADALGKGHEVYSTGPR